MNYFRLSQSVISAFETEWEIFFNLDSDYVESNFEKSKTPIHETV